MSCMCVHRTLFACALSRAFADTDSRAASGAPGAGAVALRTPVAVFEVLQARVAKCVAARLCAMACDGPRSPPAVVGVALFEWGYGKTNTQHLYRYVRDGSLHISSYLSTELISRPIPPLVSAAAPRELLFVARSLPPARDTDVHVSGLAALGICVLCVVSAGGRRRLFFHRYLPLCPRCPPADPARFPRPRPVCLAPRTGPRARLRPPDSRSQLRWLPCRLLLLLGPPPLMLPVVVAAAAMRGLRTTVTPALSGETQCFTAACVLWLSGRRT